MPALPTVDSEPLKELVELCDDYLLTTGSILWGRSFDVVADDTRNTAARWLAVQIQNVADLATTSTREDLMT